MALVAVSKKRHASEVLVKTEPLDEEAVARWMAGANVAANAAKGQGGWGLKIDKTMFAPVVLTAYADHIASKAQGKKGFNKFVFMMPNFTKAHYLGWGLNPDFTRWNDEEDCLELAVQRYIKKGDDLKTADKFFPPDKTKWKWLKVKPLSFVEYSDFNATNVNQLEGTIMRVWEFVPRERDPDKKDEYGSWAWHARRYGVEESTQKLSYDTLCSMVRTLPEELYRIEDRIHLPKGEERLDKQNIVLLRYYQPYEVKALGALLGAPAATFAQFRCRSGIDDWAVPPKDKKLLEVLPKLPGENENDKKERVLKSMGLYTTIHQRELMLTDDGFDVVESKRVAGLRLYNDQIEKIFYITDISRWMVARHMLQHMPGITVLASISPATDKDSYNLQLAEADEQGNGDDEAEPEQAEEKKDPEAASAADTDLDQLMDAQTAAPNKNQKATKFAGWLQLNGLRVFFNAPEVYHARLPRVSVKWALTPIKGSSGVSGMRPYLRTIKTAQGFPSPTDKLNAARPETLPPIVNISDRSPDATAVKAFSKLVEKGDGEFRVMTNSPMFYVKEDESPEAPAKRRVFFENVGKLSEEECEKLIDEGLVMSKEGVKVELTLSPDPQFVLLYINLHAIKPETITKKTEKAVATLSKHITNPPCLDVPMKDAPGVAPPAGAPAAPATPATPATVVATPATPAVFSSPAPPTPADIPFATVVDDGAPAAPQGKSASQADEASSEKPSKKHRTEKRDKKEKKGK